MTDETTSAPVPARPTFGSLLAALAATDELLTAPIDADDLIGSIRDRVDGLHEIVERLKAHATYMAQVAEPYLASKRAADANLRGLLDRLAFHMQAHGFQEVPGDAWRINLQPSAPRLEIKRQPSASDALNPDLKKYVDINISWKSDLVKEDLLSGALKKCDFAEIKTGQHVRFWTARATPKRPKRKEIEVKSEQSSVTAEDSGKTDDQ